MYCADTFGFFYWYIFGLVGNGGNSNSVDIDGTVVCGCILVDMMCGLHCMVGDLDWFVDLVLVLLMG